MISRRGLVHQNSCSRRRNSRKYIRNMWKQYGCVGDKPVEDQRHPCICGGKIVSRVSQYGQFYGCNNYPACLCKYVIINNKYILKK